MGVPGRRGALRATDAPLRGGAEAGEVLGGDARGRDREALVQEQRRGGAGRGRGEGEEGGPSSARPPTRRPRADDGASARPVFASKATSSTRRDSENGMWHGAETRTSAESTRSGTRPSTRYAAFASSPCARHDIVHSSAHPSGASASSTTRNACHRSSRPGQSTRASSASRSASNVAPRAGVTARATPTRRRSDAHSASRASAASAMTSEHRRPPPGGVDFSSERNPRAGRGSKLLAPR